MKTLNWHGKFDSYSGVYEDFGYFWGFDSFARFGGFENFGCLQQCNDGEQGQDEKLGFGSFGVVLVREVGNMEVFGVGLGLWI